MSHNNAPWKISAALVALAIVSVGLKYRVVRSDVAVDGPAVGRRLTIALERNGLTTRAQATFGGTLVVAEGGRCRLAVRAIPPSGELDQTFAQTFRTYPRIRYAFEGKYTAKAPRIVPTISYQLARMANRVGIRTEWRPLFIVGDNGACPASVTNFGSISAPFVQQVPDIAAQ